MPNDNPDLIALVGSRICHDLISPLGAISNGVELLMMSSASVSPEVALIGESVASASARIRAFRVAFGAAAPGHEIGRGEIVSILSDLTRGGRLSIDWQIAGSAVPRIEAKLVFLALQCFETAMPFGGRISISAEAGTLTLRGEARRLKVDPSFWAHLDPQSTASTADIGAAQVHFLLLPRTIAETGRSLKWAATETTLDMQF